MIRLAGDKNISAFDAKSIAQYIAFSPYIFQTTVALKDLGILKYIDDQGKTGATLEEITEATGVNNYGASILLDFACSCGLASFEEDRFQLSKISYFLLHDKMSQVNLDFSQHFSYLGLAQLTESIRNQKPEGLSVFGDWKTVYPHLAELPDEARRSWFAFDHFYSDSAFKKIMPLIFEGKPKHIVDIGGNTGRFALKCLTHDDDVKLTIMDLPPQLEVAQENINKEGLGDRFSAFACDMLDPEQSVVEGADVYWMSQFLDCFSEPQITTILNNVSRNLDSQQRVIILETLWDRQKFDAATLSINATSLYFCCFANGNSRMYSSAAFRALVEDCGLIIEQQVDHIGLGHSLLVCRKRQTD